jgi:hypothetical protein
MVYDDDTAPRRPRDIPPNSDVPQGRRRRQPTPQVTDEMRRIIIALVTRHPRWDVRRLHAEIRAVHRRNDVSLEMITHVLETLRAEGRNR